MKKKLDVFLNLQCIDPFTKNITTIKEIQSRLISKRLEEYSKYIIIDNKSLYDLYNEQRDEKLIKSGKYELLFIRDPLSTYDHRMLCKVIYCDDEIKNELLSFGNCYDSSPHLYYFCLPRDGDDNMKENFLILKGEFQIWESDDWIYSWLINSYQVSQINNVFTTYVCDSEIIYPSSEEVIKHLFPEITLN